MNFSCSRKVLRWAALVVLFSSIFIFIVRERRDAASRLLAKDSADSSGPAVEDKKDAGPQEPAKTFEERHADKDRIFLLDNSSLVLNEDWSFTQSVHQKVKILKESAKDLGEIPVYYIEGIEEILDLEAHTITPDGRKHSYAKSQDFNVYPDYPMYSDLRVKILSMPEVNVGSIIEIKQTIRSKGKTVPRSFWEESWLDFGFPTKEARVSYTFPKSLNIRYRPFNLGEDRQPKITESETAVTYIWDIKDAYFERSREDLAPPPRWEDIENAIEFSSFPSWDDLAGWFYEAVEENTVITPEIEEAARKIFDNQTTLKDKVRSCLEYVQDNFRYVSMSLGENNLRPHPTDEVFQNKYGDCKDLSLLTRTLLSLGGIEADMALFKERFSITDPVGDLPSPTLFDHAVLLVRNPEGEDFYVDPLLKGYDIGEYPAPYQSAYTFIIGRDKGTFGRFPEFEEGRNFREEELQVYIYPDDFDVLEREVAWDLDTSISLRRHSESSTQEEKDAFKQALFARAAPNGEVVDYRLEGVEERYGTVKGHMTIREKERFPVVSDMIIINFDGGERSESFTEGKRDYPIFFPENSLFRKTITYHFPENFRLEYLPPNLDLDNGFYRFSRTFAVKEDEIVLVDEVRYRIAEIPAEEYPNIKKFYNELPRKIRQVIILRKQKSFWEEIKNVTRRWRR
ncbi:MAG: DUF3857 domain-containing transglutaminase family protein [Candidatus Omnitrophota bacterium]